MMIHFSELTIIEIGHPCLALLIIVSEAGTAESAGMNVPDHAKREGKISSECTQRNTE